MIGGALVVILATLLTQSLAYLFKLIVDSVEAGDYSLTVIVTLSYPVLVLAGQLLFRLSGMFIRNWMIGSHKMCVDKLSSYVMKHSHGYFIDRFAGSLLSKVNNVAGALDMIIPDLLWTHLSALVSFIVTFTFLVLVDVKAGLVFLLLIIVLLVFNRRMASKKMEYSLQLASARTDLRSQLVDVFSNIQAVRQYAQTSGEEHNLNQYSTKLRDTSSKSWTYTEKMLFWNTIILFVFSLVMCWFLLQGWQAGQVSTGDLVLVLALFTQIIGTLLFIGRAFNAAARTIGEMQEGLEDLLLPYEIVDKTNAHPIFIDKASIDWKEVQFEFGEQAVFSGFNLAIPAGQRVGLVGQSGAGKSTFVSLLLRQHDIQAGSIEIDGQNIAEVTQDSLRRSIAVVPQEPALFHRTIKENILYGKPGASEAELIEVAKKAQAHDFIMSLPEGYDTMVGERGVKLSGGQKQRVAIARAMLKNAPILVLDEATSALDSESEVAIQKALHELMEGKTVIAVAHRLSTLREMDRIIVMEGGKIIEDGNHESLSQSGGVYERLWSHQAGGFLKD